MTEHQFTIADLEKMVADHEASAARVKAIINELCAKSGLAARYEPSELEHHSGGVFKIRSDQFHGRPMATCVKELLEMRRAANLGPATTNEILASLIEGAYEVGAKNTQIARVSLYNSLGKNPAFYKLPNKQWGLRAWYPNAEGESGADDKPKKSSVRKSASHKKTKKADKITKAQSATEPTTQTVQPSEAPVNQNFSDMRFEEFVRAKNRRIKDVARHFSVTKATIQKLLRKPGSKVYQAEKGWLKVRA